MGFNPVSGIGTGCWPGMKRLSAYLFDRFGGWDLGCYNPRSMAGGGPSLHAEGRAQDFAFNANDPEERAAGDALFYWAVDHADEIGLQEILWRGLIWYYPRRDEGVRDGVQQADHMSHVHLGVDKNAGMNWEPSWIIDRGGPIVTPTVEDEEMPALLVRAPSSNILLTQHTVVGCSAGEADIYQNRPDVITKRCDTDAEAEAIVWTNRVITVKG